MSIERPDPTMSEADADARLAADNRDIAAMLAKADNRMFAGDHRAANAFYGQVGRLAGEGEAIAQSELFRARDAVTWLADRFKQHILDRLDARGFTPSERHARFAKSLQLMFGEKQRDPEYVAFPQAPNLYYYPDLPYVRFADRSDFAWSPAIEEATAVVRAEGVALGEASGAFEAYVKPSRDRPQGDVHGMLGNTDWSTFDLTDKGSPSPEKIALCPETFRAISDHAPLCDIANRAPSVMFSRLRANSRIPPHTGMINARYICHLPLVIPGDGGLRVGDLQRSWREGELMVFDDSIEHEAWNNAPQDRLVLIFDIWRPELEEVEMAQIRALFEAVDSY